jgi:hypothetical protein
VGPELSAVFTCASAVLSPDGTITATEIMDGRDFETFPVWTDLCVVVKIHGASLPLPVRLHYVRAATGEVIYDLDASMPAGLNVDMGTVVIPNRYYFARPDDFLVRVIVNGNDIGGTRFTVGMRSRLN